MYRERPMMTQENVEAQARHWSLHLPVSVSPVLGTYFFPMQYKYRSDRKNS
jgi:hypothetical protein